jgi:hypothetical protein
MSENTANNIIAFENNAHDITAFLKHVAQTRTVTGHNVESCVTAPLIKLDEIEVFTIQMVVVSIPTIDSQLLQVGLSRCISTPSISWLEKGLK